MTEKANIIKTQARANSLARATIKSALLSNIVHYKDLRLKDGGGNANMNQDGSGGAINFKVAPGAGELFYVDYLTLLLIDAGDMGVAVFGSLLAALPNGLEVHGQLDGQAHSFTILNDNGDLFQCFFGGSAGATAPAGPTDAGFLDTVDKAGGKMPFHYPVILDGDKGDFIAVKVQDDLLGIDYLKTSAHLKVIQ